MRLLPVASLFALLLLAAPAQAQMLTSGTWTGTLGSGRSARPATAEIERCATGFSVALTTGGRTVRTETATYSRGRLAFAMTSFRRPGTRTNVPLSCALQMDREGHLVGTCEAGRTRLPLRLTPPADGSLGC